MMRDGRDDLDCYRAIAVGAARRGNSFATWELSWPWRGYKRVPLWKSLR